jgi:hypothetical protein
LGGADDVRRDGSRDEAGHETESSFRDDVEAGTFDRREGVAAGVTASAAEGPEDVDGALQARKTRRLGANVFVEAQLAAGSDDAAELGEGTVLVGDGAEDERRDAGVEHCIASWKCVGDTVDDFDREVDSSRGSRRELAQERFGFDREDMFDGVRVVREVKAVAGADFDHAAREACEQLVAVLGGAFGFGFGGHARVAASEDRVSDRGRVSGHG